MSLSLPATWSTMVGDAAHTLWRRANALTNLAAMRDCGDMRVAHDTEGVLSQ